VTGGGRAPASTPQDPSASTQENDDGRRSDTVIADDEDWAITPAVLPLEPMVLMGASWEQLGPQRSMHPGGEEQPPPSVLTVDELANLLRVNRKTVYDALSRDEIPGARRVGGRYRIHRDAVLEWLASGQDRVSRSRRNR
jgi:excisionase family DNA binding protein